MTLISGRVGMPPIRFTGQRIDLAAEARKARRRLYPVSVVYSAYAATVLALGVPAHGPWRPLAFFAGGTLAWTLLEYLVHRYILHGRFPEGPGMIQRWLHRSFDSLHTEHHARPWDGNHINGTIKDTWLYASLFAALSFLAPLPTAPAFFAGVIQTYVVEEWVHQSVHFIAVYRLRGAYWRYITRHHLYHHSPRGSELAFGLTNGFWDIAFDTRIPGQDRRLLYRRA